MTDVEAAQKSRKTTKVGVVLLEKCRRQVGGGEGGELGDASALPQVYADQFKIHGA